MSFETFNLNPAVMAGIIEQGYTTPTPIQVKAIPPIMQGRDIIGLAQTGTGKTAAFALPVLHRLMQSPKGKVRALIVSPTRELAEQTCEAINTLGKKTGLRSISIYGGVSFEEQSRNLRRGAELIVACPGRLLDHLLKGSIELSHLEVLIIDEADRMFDMGFLPDIRSIVRCLTQPHQTLLFSATMPDDIRRLVREVLTDPLTVQVGFAAPAASVSHSLYPVKPHLKTALLKQILMATKTESILVFTRTKRRCERLADQLNRSGYHVATLQGDMTQWARTEAIEGFRDGSQKILVATDIAARGLDILTISHVINYDMPDTVDAYTHRIGRTGRVDNTGEAFTLVTREDEDMIKALERIFKKPIESRKVEGFNYDAPAPARDDSMPARKVFNRESRSPRRQEAPTGSRTSRERPASGNTSTDRGNSNSRERNVRRERVSSR